MQWNTNWDTIPDRYFNGNLLTIYGGIKAHKIIT